MSQGDINLRKRCELRSEVAMPPTTLAGLPEVGSQRSLKTLRK
jgi:hypothetical protein